MINNPRLNGKLAEFANKLQLPEDISLRFQTFANYLICRKRYFEVNKKYPYDSMLDKNFLDFIDLDTPNEKAMAADGCMIVYKNKIIHLGLDKEEIKEVLDGVENSEDSIIDVTLVQTKSGAFDISTMSDLSACLKNNFNGQDKWEKLSWFKDECNKLLQQKDKVIIRFNLFYVLGQKFDIPSDGIFLMRESDLKRAMQDYFWITDAALACITYLDAEKVYEEYTKQQELYKKINVSVTFKTMSDEVECGEFGKIRFCAITLGELMKVLQNADTGELNELYEWNVRDFINDSHINNNIKESIVTNSELFLLLNNGITMIVDSQERRGDKGLNLTNIRIVNGCQTSHAIFEVCKDNQEHLDAMISVRIIQTNKPEIAGNITYSSNNQNPIKKTNLLAIEQKIFELEKRYEDFFLENPNIKPKKILLERRQGQFFKCKDVEYIDLLAQAKAYVALWELSPHIAVQYADEVMDKYQKAIQADSLFIEHSLLAGIVWSEVHRDLPNNYHSARYQIFVYAAVELLKNFYKKNSCAANDAINEIKTKNGCLEILKQPEIFTEKFIKAVYAKFDYVKSQLVPGTPSDKSPHYRTFYKPEVLNLMLQ